MIFDSEKEQMLSIKCALTFIFFHVLSCLFSLSFASETWSKGAFLLFVGKLLLFLKYIYDSTVSEMCESIWKVKHRHLFQSFQKISRTAQGTSPFSGNWIVSYYCHNVIICILSFILLTDDAMWSFISILGVF